MENVIGNFNQWEPFQYSKLLVWKLNPNVPVFGFFGRPGVFQEGIPRRPYFTDKPWWIAILRPVIREFLNSIGASGGINFTAERLAEREGDGDAEGLRLADETAADGDVDAEELLPPADGDGDALGETDADAETDALGLVDAEALSPPAEGEALGERDSEGETDADGETDSLRLADGE